MIKAERALIGLGNRMISDMQTMLRIMMRLPILIFLGRLTETENM